MFNNSISKLHLKLQDKDREIKNAINFISVLKNINSELKDGELIFDDNSELLRSLHDLKTRLQKFIEEEKVRNWITWAEAEISQIQQEKSNLTDYGNSVLNKIINILNARQACLFVHQANDQEEYLELLATYGCEKEKIKNKRIEIGNGILGQAFCDGGLIQVPMIPANYLKVKSGLGESIPKSLIVAVLEVDKKSVGVIELAFLTSPLPHQIEFIELSRKNIAQAIAKFKESEINFGLLTQSQALAQEIKEREEQLQIRLKEVQTIQEDMERKNGELEKSKSDIELQNEEIENLNSLIESKLETQRSLYETQIDLLKRKLEATKSQTSLTK